MNNILKTIQKLYPSVLILCLAAIIFISPSANTAKMNADGEIVFTNFPYIRVMADKEIDKFPIIMQCETRGYFKSKNKLFLCVRITNDIKNYN